MPVRECFTNPKIPFCCVHAVKPEQELEVLSAQADFCLIPALPRGAVCRLSDDCIQVLAKCVTCQGLHC